MVVGTVLVLAGAGAGAEPWQQLQFTNWPGTYVFMAFVGAITIYESRRNSPSLRAIDAVLSVCVAFAGGQMAGFHIGQQADEWAIVAIAAFILASIVSVLCHAFIPGSAEKP